MERMHGNNNETEDETRSRHIYPEICKQWKRERIRENFYTHRLSTTRFLL
jgi:hypothetical protein